MHPIECKTAAISVAAFLVMAVTAHAEDSFNPFRVPRERVQQQVRTIALIPVSTPAGSQNRQAVQKMFEELVESAARGAGYTVVPSSVFDKAWRANAARLGGIYDPATGSGDVKKFDTCFEFTARDLARSHGVDAIVQVAITTGRHHAVFVQPPLSLHTKAYTYGKPIVLRGRELTSEWIEQIQYLEGSYFNFALRDSNGHLMFGMRMPVEWQRIYWRRGYDDRGEPAFADAAKNQAIVSRVFSWLTRGVDLESEQ